MLNNADALTVHSEDIRALQSSSPSFWVWAREAWIKGYLDIVVEAVITTGVANDVPGTLAYLQAIYLDQVGGSKKVALTDFAGKNPWNKLHARLSIALGKTKPATEQDLTLMHGIIGHAALPRLFSSRLFRERNHRVLREEMRQSLLSFSPKETEIGQMTFGFGADVPATYDAVGRLESGKSVLARTALKRAMTFWKEHRLAVNEDNRAQWRVLVPRLRVIMEPIFGHYVSRLDLHPAANPEMTFLTLMSWASTLYYWKENYRRVLFSEINTVLSTHGFPGGRVDAVELRRIEGERLTRKQGLILESLKVLRNRSAGELVGRFQRQFPGVLEIAILDWKFAVGDALVRGEIIKPSDIAREPFPKHRFQVERYLALAILDHSLQHGIRYDDEVWAQYGHRLTADVVYFLPGTLPIVHTVAPDTALLKEVFTTSTAQPWDNARDRSTIRLANNAILGHLLGLIEGGHKGKQNKNGTSATLQAELFDGRTGYASVTDIIEKHKNGKTAVDVHGIIFKTANGSYEMHFDRLVAAVERDDIGTRNFSAEYGGKVSCMMPGHDDSGPSMHIYLDGTPRFFCFGCEARGIIAVSSLPDHFEISPSTFRRHHMPMQTGEKETSLDILIPERYHHLFTTLQESLASAFHGSSAERYVAYKRRIDPDLAFTYGAGFGTSALLNDLLDAKCSLEELATSGIIRFSSEVKPDSVVPRLLKRHGMHIEELTRTVKKKPALPYCLLFDRVTFPLTFEGRLSNFYARSISPRGLPHVKLSTHLTQGGFNMVALADPNSSEVIMTEGAFDALTLISMGFTNVFSLIGVFNVPLFGSIMRSGKDLATAFDRDSNVYKTGQTKTLKIEKKLREWGFPGRVCDYTEAFIQKLPPEERPSEGDGTKWDFNGWWCDPARRR
ncbi:MAG: toprim domain-containing protein [Candidatus Campbellbacteria bacterium]|nr:toprim domain-containing protein [Candidatus Campbellbacteria bacterium]